MLVRTVIKQTVGVTRIQTGKETNETNETKQKQKQNKKIIIYTKVGYYRSRLINGFIISVLSRYSNGAR